MTKDYMLYDKIVSATIANIVNTGKEVVYKNFNEKNIKHMYMYKVGLICASLNKDFYILLDMPLYKYIFFKIKNWKNRKFIKRARKKDNQILNIDLIISYMTCAFYCDEEIIADIYNEYYN